MRRQLRTTGGDVESGHSALTRRDRLERIATAERDRRAGRVEVAIAAIGEPSEWPARVVLALSLLPQSADEDTLRARRLLEAGLDHWAHELGLEALDAAAIPSEPAPESVEPFDDAAELAAELAAFEPPPASDLGPPIALEELERAFAAAEAQTDEMHDVNRVAERVLMDEAVGLAELSGEMLMPAEPDPATLELASPVDAQALDAAVVEEFAPATTMTEVIAERTGRPTVEQLAILEGWLANLERRRAGRAR